MNEQYCKKNGILIGWASRDVSTDKPVNIPGQFHMRISQGIIDPITVSALVIDNGDDSVIFLSADIVVIRSCLIEKIRAKVAKINPEIPILKILMNATHTHTGPTTYGEKLELMAGSSTASSDELPDSGVEIASADVYQDFFTSQAAEAVAEAYLKRASGGIAYGYGYAVVGHSRRVVYFDDLSKRPGAVINSTHGINGHAAMYGNTNDPMFSHYEAGADHFINLLYTFDVNGKLTGAVVNVPCPSQNSEGEYRLSASYWSEARDAIRAKYGNIFILPQCAAGGDLAPRILHYKNAETRRFKLKYGTDNPNNVSEYFARKDIGERIACAFTEVLDWAKKDIKTALPIRHVVETVNLSKRLILKDEYKYAKTELKKLDKQKFKTDGTPLEQLYANSSLVAGRNRYRRIIVRYETQEADPKLPMELHVLRIGDIAFASNRFELYMDFQHRIQARSPFEQTFIVQLCGTPGSDGGTYLATERGSWGKGYSASMYCNVVSPQGGQELVEETLKVINTLWKE
jgi:hypothetical protein